ncbi:MAG: YybH family protein [Candidatus Korobacteraceae bacterium]
MLATSPREIHALFLDAFNRGDVESLVALHEPNASLVTRDGTVVGHGAIRAAYQKMLLGGARMDLSTRAVIECGEGLALLHASWTYHRRGTATPGLSTEVVRRQPDGTWLSPH